MESLTPSKDSITLKGLLEAGLHFGHQVSRWNPRMKPYIFGVRNGIHIIDLEQTLVHLHKAHRFVADQVARGANVLFVGTKPQAQEVIEQAATRVKMAYVRHRWLGGMLTNFQTIKQSIQRMKQYYQRLESGEIAKLHKKEQLQLSREIEKVEKTMGGIRDMDNVPGLVILVDPNREHIAQREANRLKIPVIALADSNCNPEGVDYLIPGNDDAMRSIQLVLNVLADAVEEGMAKRQEFLRKEVEAKSAAQAATHARNEERKVTARARAFVAKDTAEPATEAAPQPATATAS